MTSAEAPLTFPDEDLPVLRATLRLLDARPGPVRGVEIAEACELDDDTVFRALRRLVGPGNHLVQSSAAVKMNHTGLKAMLISGATEQGRRAGGQWPSADKASKEILEHITQLIEKEPGLVKTGAVDVGAGVLTGGFLMWLQQYLRQFGF